MKILLVGEYSRLHNSLKEGLVHLGHEVFIVGAGDGFKEYPVDIELKASFFTSWFGNICRQLIYRATKFDLASLEILFRYKRLSKRLSGFDVVQLINESPFLTSPSVEKKIIASLKENNKKIFLLSCGNDHSSVSYAVAQVPRYSVFTPLLENPELKSHYRSSLKYIEPAYKELHEFVFDIIDGVIATDLDYHLPLLGHEKYLGLIPNPVNLEKHPYRSPEIQDKVNIFLGINTTNYIKKGVPIFRKVLERIQETHPDKVTIITTKDLPYATYIDHYDEAHIIMDQVYSFDQGYNALEAMARGKVVFTGAEIEFYEHYKDATDIACNASPNEERLYQDLEHLILNKDAIRTMSRNARDFIEKEHDHIDIAEKYLSIYTSS